MTAADAAPPQLGSGGGSSNQVGGLSGDQDTKPTPPPPAPELAPGVATGGFAASDGRQGGGQIWPWVEPPDRPMENARLLVKRKFTTPEHDELLLYHRGIFRRWSGTAWPELEDSELQALVYLYFEDAVYEAHWDWDGKVEPAPFHPNRAKVGEIVAAMQAVTHLSQTVEMPSWLGGNGPVNPSDVLPLANGLVVVPDRRLLAPTPKFFCPYSLPYPYDPTAPIPHRWHLFLQELWPDDEQSISTLQEVVGYLLLPDTSQQKAFLLVGPKRSGKGTIARVITGLLGRENVAGPTLASLSSQFGLQALLDRPVAVISDARLSGRGDGTVVVERLLSISGEDTLTIDRKYLKAWTGKLPTRLLLLSNEVPRLLDASGAWPAGSWSCG